MIRAHFELVKDYTQIALWLGVCTYIIFRSLAALLNIRVIGEDEFHLKSVDVRSFIDSAWSGALFADKQLIELLLYTNLGLTIIIYIIGGFAACYQFRSAIHPVHEVAAPRR